MTLTVSKFFLIVAFVLLVAAALGATVHHLSLVILAAALFVAAQLGL